MFVPAMPGVARDLGTQADTVQLTVTLYLMGLGIGQLAAGPVADRFGRRPALLCGLALFVAGAVGCALADSASLLVAARVVQSLGAAAGLVAVRAIVADTSSRENAARRMGTLMSVVLVSPAISPLIGGGIASLGGWRLIFVVLAGAGVAGWLAAFLRITESRAAADGGGTLLHNYGRLVRNGRFLRYAAAIAASSCALYIFLSCSAFLLIDGYGLTPAEAGLCYFLVAGAGILGALSVGRFERRGGAFRLGLLGAVIGGGTMQLLALAGFDGPIALMAPMILVGFGTGVAAPAGVAGAMHAEAGLAATSASLVGALQMVASGLTTSIIVQLHIVSFGALATGLFAAALAGLIATPPGRAADAAPN